MSEQLQRDLAAREIASAERLLTRLDPYGDNNTWQRMLAHCRHEYGCCNYDQVLREVQQLNFVLRNEQQRRTGAAE